MRNLLDEIVDLNDQVTALQPDATRYRFLREQQWETSNLFVIAGSKSRVKLGTDCPRLDRLDDAIDAAIAEKNDGQE